MEGHESLQAVVTAAVERPLVVPAGVHQVDVAALVRVRGRDGVRVRVRVRGRGRVTVASATGTSERDLWSASMLSITRRAC